ncbi:helix-turn-helix transcriptional regulator [Micromonospora sp. NPDC049679]|uniref:helix-turn-helix domain-containing protein n=1 Tax=Micromonospora sp. NPDC049679 TaxID=3155920 RepID=UPI00340F0064
MTTTRLSTLLGDALRRQRELHSLTQRELADRAEVSQTTVARVERGVQTPNMATLERLFAAVDAQLTVGLEPLDAHVDAAIVELTARPVAERIAAAGVDKAMDGLGDIPFVFDGPTAALLQGAPVPVPAVDIALAWRDADAFTEWLTRKYAHRWHEKWQEFGYLALDPREPGAHRWQTMVGEIRARMLDELPEAIEIRHGERRYRVVPLAEVEITDARAAGLLRRYRRQRAESPLGARRVGSAG